MLKQRYPRLSACVSRYAAIPGEFYRKLIGNADVDVFDGPLREMLGSADCAFVASGTATLETALLGVPLVVTYHASTVTHAIFKHFIRVPYIGLPNIIAGEAIVRNASRSTEPAAGALALERFIVSPELYNNTVSKLISLRKNLGERKPSIEVCAILKSMAEQGVKG